MVHEKYNVRFYTFEEFQNSPPFLVTTIEQFSVNALGAIYGAEFVAARRQIIAAGLAYNTKLFTSGKATLLVLTRTHDDQENLAGLAMLLNNCSMPTLVQFTACDIDSYKMLFEHSLGRFRTADALHVVLHRENILNTKLAQNCDAITRVSVPACAAEDVKSLVCYSLSREGVDMFLHELLAMFTQTKSSLT